MKFEKNTCFVNKKKNCYGCLILWYFQRLSWLCLTVFSSLRSSLLLVHIFIPNLFLPVNFAFNMLWHSTLWTLWGHLSVHLSVMILCDLLSLWRCQWLSSGPLPSQQCSSLLWFQRTRDTQNLYCMNLLKLKCKYSTILRYWIFDFHEL